MGIPHLLPPTHLRFQILRASDTWRFKIATARGCSVLRALAPSTVQRCLGLEFPCSNAFGLLQTSRSRLLTFHSLSGSVARHSIFVNVFRLSLRQYGFIL